MNCAVQHIRLRSAANCFANVCVKIKNTPRNIYAPFQPFLPEKSHEYCAIDLRDCSVTFQSTTIAA
jgi:hypothetical protein